MRLIYARVPEFGKRAGMIFEKRLLPNLSFPKKKSCGLVPTQVQILSLANF